MNTLNKTVIYTVEDLMDIFHCTRVTAYKYIKSGEFPVRKLGKRYWIPKEPFEEWLNNCEDEHNCEHDRTEKN